MYWWATSHYLYRRRLLCILLVPEVTCRARTLRSVVVRQQHNPHTNITVSRRNTCIHTMTSCECLARPGPCFDRFQELMGRVTMLEGLVQSRAHQTTATQRNDMGVSMPSAIDGVSDELQELTQDQLVANRYSPYVSGVPQATQQTKRTESAGAHDDTPWITRGGTCHMSRQSLTVPICVQQECIEYSVPQSE